MKLDFSIQDLEDPINRDPSALTSCATLGNKLHYDMCGYLHEADDLRLHRLSQDSEPHYLPLHAYINNHT